MKLTLTVVLSLIGAAISQSAEVSSSSIKQREIASSVVVRKRTPTPLRSVAPGIEYYENNGLEVEKSPKQNIYATPLPQLAKISDVLTGQGPPFQAAINSHLFSPVSIYTSRIPGYEVSAPIPAQLAYSERNTYQPPPPQIFVQNQKPQSELNYQPLQYQSNPQPQIIPQAQPISIQQLANQYQPLIQPQSQFLAIPYFQSQSPIYNQAPFPFQNPFQSTPQPLRYIAQQIPKQPGIEYTGQKKESEKLIQREQQTNEPIPQQNIPQNADQTFSNQNNGAVSYASFSVGPPVFLQAQHQLKPQAQLYPQPPKIQLLLQTQQNQTQQQPELQQYHVETQPQINNYPTRSPSYQQQIQSKQYQLQQPEQYQVQESQYKVPQPIAQTQHQYQIQREPLISKSILPYYQDIQRRLVIRAKQLHIQPKATLEEGNKPAPTKTYYKPEPDESPKDSLDQEFYRNDLSPQTLPVSSFPPVQFHGKYAHEIFKNYRSWEQ